MKPRSRKLLQEENRGRATTLSPSFTYSPDPLLQPINGSPSTLINRPFKPNYPFDFSMALTALVLLTALFFMGFFSIYSRRFSDVSSAHRRRRPPPPPLLPSTYPNGLDPSAVRSLPLISYRGDAKHPIDCAICLSEFEEREGVKLIPHCRHVFHAECLDTWLCSHVSCPLCRSTQLFGGVEEVCLGVSQGEEGGDDDDHGVGEDQGGLTVERSDTWVEEGREVGPVDLRRTCSCSSLGDQAVQLQRSLSF
ncbi:RING-H2 finger protein ATL57 [Camellia lanceoleosa]|uniref:RING-H2 finger protein ATL57 n=1 Tax=Camellia lanceoleosa TaxID=1840588 RepID=A0ACC0F5I9_9ERIC|nr:RING-H2 finger protein ATL57 [Camellia lanceoleosa]